MAKSVVDVKSLNPFQLKSVVQDLKNCGDDEQMISSFQLLGRFCTLGDGTSNSLLENAEFAKFLSHTIGKHENKAVQIHACAFLFALSLSTGEFNKLLMTDTALSMFMNLFQETECPQNLELVEAIEDQLKNAPFSFRALDGFVSIIQKLTGVLNSDKTPESTKRNVIDVLSDILDGDFFSHVFQEVTETSTSSSSSSLPSSFHLTGAANPPAFLLCLADLSAVLTSLSAKARGRLHIYSEGLLTVILKKFNVKAKINIEEKEEENLAVVLLPQSPLKGVPYEKNMVKFQGNQTVSIDCELLDRKIYILDLVLTGLGGFGIVLKTTFALIIESHMYNAKGACCLMQRGDLNLLRQNVVKLDELWKSDETVQVRLELDTSSSSSRTLLFFVKGTQIAHAVTSVPHDVHFAFFHHGGGASSGYNDGVVSFRTVTCSTADLNVKRTQHNWS